MRRHRKEQAKRRERDRARQRADKGKTKEDYVTDMMNPFQYWKEFLPNPPKDPHEAEALEMFLHWCLDHYRDPVKMQSLAEYANHLKPHHYFFTPEEDVFVYDFFRRHFPFATWQTHIRPVRLELLD